MAKQKLIDYNSYFFPYQRDFIADKSRFKIIEKARQIGLSLACAFKVHEDRKDINAKKKDCIICSKNEGTAQEFLDYVKMFVKQTNAMLGEEYIKEGLMTKSKIIYPNGSKVIAISSNPEAFRGLSGDVILDEFAFHDDQERLLAAAVPCSTWNAGSIYVISTHNGPGTVFCDLLKNNKYKHWKITIEDACRDGFMDKIEGDHLKIADKQERAKAYIQFVKDRCLNEQIFKQEYMCEVIGAGSMIPEVQYNKVILPGWKVPRTHYPPLEKIGNLYAGIDIGFTKDWTVFWVIERAIDPTQKNPRLKYVYRPILVRAIKGDYDSQFEILSSLLNNPKIRRCLVEENGVGWTLAEQLTKQFPNKVECWTNSSPSKSLAIERLSGFVASERFALPEDHEIKLDILSMMRIPQPNGSTKYVAGTKTTHGDFYISAALSLAAAEDNGLKNIYVG